MLLAFFTIPFSITAYASESSPLVFSVNGTRQNDEIFATVKLVKNTGVTAMTLTVSYDSEVCEYIGYTKKSALSEMSFLASEQGSEKVIFLYDSSTLQNVTSTGELLELRFKLRENIPAGEYYIGLLTNECVAEYMDGKEAKTKSIIVDSLKVTVNGSGSVVELLTQESEDPTDNSEGLGTLAIVLISVGSAVVAAGIVVAVILLRRRAINEKYRKQLEKDGFAKL
ncbi:MAG: cohesin domain-containing protein [Candidatus Coproplasma sp.]